jgi:hypothetical protein
MSRQALRMSVWAASVFAAAVFAARCSSGPDTSATTALIAELKQKSLPGMPDPLTPEKALEIERWRTGPGGWFVQKGCFACHDVSVYGIKSNAGMGPDLAQAVDDVKSRFGMPLEEFLKQPVGTMTVVLTQMIPLTPEEKTVALEKLLEANREFVRQKKAN